MDYNLFAENGLTLAAPHVARNRAPVSITLGVMSYSVLSTAEKRFLAFLHAPPLEEALPSIGTSSRTIFVSSLHCRTSKLLAGAMSCQPTAKPGHMLVTLALAWFRTRASRG